MGERIRFFRYCSHGGVDVEDDVLVGVCLPLWYFTILYLTRYLADSSLLIQHYFGWRRDRSNDIGMPLPIGMRPFISEITYEGT